ncbi:TonB-dependent receptor plug domain-containing protein [Pseudomonas aeruginosa]|nr:TonB-dependent receptor plug domain-containing protein [Pseudomonas aeruginosa]
MHGSLDAEEALQRLLQGSGLRARRIDERTLTLEPIPASGALDLDATTVSAAAPAQGYRPAANAWISRGDAPLLEIPQAISVVPAQALQDQRPRNLDDALGNISGITQANTLGGTQDAVMKRGFGDNRDGSIMRDGMPSVQGRNFTATADHVEVLKGQHPALWHPGPGRGGQRGEQEATTATSQRPDPAWLGLRPRAQRAAAASSTPPARWATADWPTG